MINVTKAYLPPIEEYIEYLEKIWASSWLTNNGPLVQELEDKLKKYLGVKHLFFTSNGTIALQIAIKALGLKGEIITTPFSYVATTTSILWENCNPVFVDINPKTFCIDHELVEQKITPNTEAILATHVYGIPCAVDEIEKIAQKYKLKIIYDAAHSFGTIYNGKALASYGDISTLSFHATKLFHTIEGGAIITNDNEIARRINLFRSFGHIGDEYFSIGINGKNSEFHAAMGLCLIPRIHDFIEERKQLCALYDSILLSHNFIRPVIPEQTIYNYSYYPILFNDEDTLIKVKAELIKNGITPRRYFYPSLNKLPYINTMDKCHNSDNYSQRVICLPLYIGLRTEEIEKICNIIINAQ